MKEEPPKLNLSRFHVMTPEEIKAVEQKRLEDGLTGIFVPNEEFSSSKRNDNVSVDRTHEHDKEGRYLLFFVKKESGEVLRLKRTIVKDGVKDNVKWSTEDPE